MSLASINQLLLTLECDLNFLSRKNKFLNSKSEFLPKNAIFASACLIWINLANMKLLLPLKKIPKIILALTFIAILPVALNLFLNKLPYMRIFLLDLCEAFALAYVFGWLIIFLSKKGHIAFVSFYAILSFIASMFVIVSMRPLTAESLMLVLQTDSREILSCLHQFVVAKKIVLTFCIILLYGAILRLTFTKRPLIKFRLRNSFKKILSVLIGIVITIGIIRFAIFCRIFVFDEVYGFEQWYTDASDVSPKISRLEEYRNGELIANILFAYQGLYLNSKELPQWEKTQREIILNWKRHSAEVDSMNIVIIIGESFIKRHSNLYGYPLLTNPYLTAEKDSGRLVVFNDFITTANFTAESIRNIMNINDLSKSERWSKSAYFPLLTALYGWKVHLYDNQFVKPNHISDLQLSAMMRNPLLDNDCYEWTNDSIDKFDGDFIRRVEREYPFDNSVGNLDIFHLYGQHFAPKDRYPNDKKYNRWTGDSLPYDRPWLNRDKREVIAQYDNATLYNDGVVGSIINRYKATPTLIIYFSDHGEEMFDTSDCSVRNEPSGDYAGWLQRQFEIPFFIWGSDKYIQNHQQHWELVRNAINKPGMLDNLGQIVLGLCRITDSRYYKPSRDILNPEYKIHPRITSQKKLNYDELVKDKK